MWNIDLNKLNLVKLLNKNINLNIKYQYNIYIKTKFSLNLENDKIA